MESLIIGLTALLGLYMAWNIGANDVSNSMADAVGSKAISIRNAVIAAGICEFSGAVLVGAQVTDTVRKGIVDPSVLSTLPGITPEDAAVILVLGMSAALLSAAFWLNISTMYGLPVSTTHSIVGAVAGFGIVAAGWQAVNWDKMGQIVASWFISPVAGGITAYMIFSYISKSILGKEKPALAAIPRIPLISFVMTFVVMMATIYKGLTHVIGDIPWINDQSTVSLSLAVSVVAGVVSYFFNKGYLKDKGELSIGKQLDAVEKMFVPLVVVSSCSVAFAHGAN
ncbi:MAG: inorganic phosphate transporter, partial [Desulfobulbaceae bacterium]|nr:inorganic phosphate transporter [Desulfobulbaceae bacterium]